MGDIAMRPAGLPDLLREPVFSPRVEVAVRQYLDYAAHGNLRRLGVPVLPEVLRKRAAQYVAIADQQGVPATFDTIRKWLLIVTSGVNNPPVAADFAARITAIEFACQYMPGWGFSDDTARTALMRFKWLPSAAEVRDLIAEATAPRLAKIRALRALATVQGPEPETQAPSEEARREMAARLRAVVAENAARAEATERANPSGRPVKATHLPPDLLAAQRDASPLVQAARAAREGG